nr:uncharacterized mitochondrial protein AtMg00810-like [Tanacetum cinerariifolium]
MVGLTHMKAHTTSTPIDTEKPLLKDPDGEDVDVHNYRSMIGLLMYLTSSRPDIMFAVGACARFQMTPKASHLHAVKRIFIYLKGKPHLGLWYPKDSPFDLVAYSDSDYADASLDRKSTTGGCQFLGCRLISWQCKKQTVVATSSTEAEYVAAASCCRQVLWIQNQLLDYGVVGQLQWHFRPHDADWAMVGSYFVQLLLQDSIPSWYADGSLYKVLWCDVEEVFMPINETDQHWCLAHLHIRTGLVTFYGSGLTYDPEWHEWMIVSVPTPYSFRLLGFNMDKELIMEVDDIGYQMDTTL